MSGVTETNIDIFSRSKEDLQNLKLNEAFQSLIEEDIETKIETLSLSEAEELCNKLQKNFD